MTIVYIGLGFFLGSIIATIVGAALVASHWDTEQDAFYEELRTDLIRAGYAPEQADRIMQDARFGTVHLDNIRTLGGWS